MIGSPTYVLACQEPTSDCSEAFPIELHVQLSHTPVLPSFHMLYLVPIIFFIQSFIHFLHFFISILVFQTFFISLPSVTIPPGSVFQAGCPNSNILSLAICFVILNSFPLFSVHFICRLHSLCFFCLLDFRFASHSPVLSRATDLTYFSRSTFHHHVSSCLGSPFVLPQTSSVALSQCNVI